MAPFEFRLKFQWSLFQNDKKKSSIGFGNGLAQSKWHAITWNDDDKNLWRQMASLGRQKLTIWCINKMANIWQTIYSNAVYQKKIYV